MTTHNPLIRILDTNKLTGPNFDDWYRNLRIVLASESIQYVLTDKQPQDPIDDLERESLKIWKKDDVKAKCYMLASMSNELQKQHENIDSSASILLHLQELYGKHSRIERYRVSKELFGARMSEGTSVHEHVLKMISNMESLEGLGFGMDFELQTDLILQSLPESFSQFVMNFQMNKLEATLSELLNMLVVAENQIKKTKGTVLVTEKFSKAKGKPKAKGKKFFKPKTNTMKKKKKQEAVPKGKCFHCGKEGHWRRNCFQYLASKKAAPVAGSSEQAKAQER